MHYTDVVKVWEYHLERLGCWESEHGDWIFETPELVIVLSFKVDDREKDFYIDIGILFKKLHSYEELEAPVIDNHDIVQGLYNVLRDMGEWEYYLNNLFCYNADINTDYEVIINISEITGLFKSKIMPYIEELDRYARLAEDFEEAVTWKPFLRYFRPHPLIDECFNGLLKAYYRRK